MLYIAKNDNNKRFLIYCSNINELRYSIVRLTTEAIINLIENKVTLYDTMQQEAIDKYIADVENDNSVIPRSIIEFNEKDLPLFSAFYGKTDESVDEYLKCLKLKVLK